MLNFRKSKKSKQLPNHVLPALGDKWAKYVGRRNACALSRPKYTSAARQYKWKKKRTRATVWNKRNSEKCAKRETNLRTRDFAPQWCKIYYFCDGYIYFHIFCYKYSRILTFDASHSFICESKVKMDNSLSPYYLVLIGT